MKFYSTFQNQNEIISENDCICSFHTNFIKPCDVTSEKYAAAVARHTSLCVVFKNAGAVCADCT